MNDRLPGSCWDNPVWHRGWRIYLSDLFNVHGYQYDFVHDSYDGAPDSGDSRYGQAHTVEEAKALINEKEDD